MTEPIHDEAFYRSKAGADELLSYVEKTTREIFVGEGHVNPVAALWTYRDPDTYVLSHQMHMALCYPCCGQDAKSLPESVQLLARQLDAFALALVSEAHSLTIPTVEHLPKERLEKVPGSEEILMIHFEHAALPRNGCLSRAVILRETPGDESARGEAQPWKRLGFEADGLRRAAKPHARPATRCARKLM